MHYFVTILFQVFSGSTLQLALQSISFLLILFLLNVMLPSALLRLPQSCSLATGAISQSPTRFKRH